MAAYGDDSGLSAYLEDNGLALPTGAPSLAVLREIGSTYVDAAYEHRLGCSQRAGGWAQPLAWPRSGHKIRGESLPDDVIPPQWITASYRAAYLQASQPGWATNSTDANRMTKREQVDTISREFFAAGENGASDVAPGMSSDGIINGLVLPLLCSNVRDASALFRVV